MKMTTTQFTIKILIVLRYSLIFCSLLVLSNVYFEVRDFGASILDVLWHDNQSSVSVYKSQNMARSYLMNTYIEPAFLLFLTIIPVVLAQYLLEGTYKPVRWGAQRLENMNARQRKIVRVVVVLSSVIGGPVSFVFVTWWLMPYWILVEYKYAGSK
ncbi:hypothetical protein [Vibrio sp. 10N.222.55.E7]|uniref:hypothetical protein n=1 Tax=Vibrio sp. 10N.222.55.E7 TaxID=3229651 RepID=UPI0035510305